MYFPCKKKFPRHHPHGYWTTGVALPTDTDAHPRPPRACSFGPGQVSSLTTALQGVGIYSRFALRDRKPHTREGHSPQSRAVPIAPTSSTGPENYLCESQIAARHSLLKILQRLPTAYVAPPKLDPAAKTLRGLAATCLSEPVSSACTRSQRTSSAPAHAWPEDLTKCREGGAEILQAPRDCYAAPSKTTLSD